MTPDNLEDGPAVTKPTDIDVSEYRQADAEVLNLMLNRWSPRAMSGAPISDAERASLLEAARWAPSCFNAQPWRFLYATKGSAHWDAYFDLLIAPNQAWVSQAGLLLVLLSRRRFEHNGEPTDTNSFDAGAAWQNVALQASSMGLVAHGMRGFDKQRARVDLDVPELFEIEAMIAVGHPGEIEALPETHVEREKPSPRKAVHEFAQPGKFAF